MKLITDVISFTYREVPKWNPTNVCSYHLQEAGATPVQELAYALATAIAVLDHVKASGQVPAEDFPQVVGRISFFVNAGLRFITEICKMRAFTELWDEYRTRYRLCEHGFLVGYAASPFPPRGAQSNDPGHGLSDFIRDRVEGATRR